MASEKEIADILSERVTYEQAAEIMCISLRELRREISAGRLVVIQPPRGWTKGRIEIGAIRAWLEDRNREATLLASRRRRQAAQKQGCKPGGRTAERSAECIGQR
ncbi:hypothetical protein [Saccharopolyspora kobensis]|uniref:hypothetical protein n=1 Tax=Saccharopolyspora kobensis TaxID=146035 RepID=UPI0015A538AB|nr:hypothetical protein [Saccharopolyspora kobensis]